MVTLVARGPRCPAARTCWCWTTFRDRLRAAPGPGAGRPGAWPTRSTRDAHQLSAGAWNASWQASCRTRAGDPDPSPSTCRRPGGRHEAGWSTSSRLRPAAGGGAQAGGPERAGAGRPCASMPEGEDARGSTWRCAPSWTASPRIVGDARRGAPGDHSLLQNAQDTEGRLTGRFGARVGECPIRYG